MKFFCSLEGFLKKGPQRVQKGHMRALMALRNINIVIFFARVAFLRITRSFYCIKESFLDMKFFWVFEGTSENSP